MQLSLSSPVFTHLALLTAQIFWASMTIWLKYAQGFLSPLVFLVFRLGCSAGFFHAVNAARTRVLPPRRDMVYMLLLSIFGVLAFTACFQVGLQYSTAINASIFDLVTTVLTSFLALLLRREAFSWFKVLGIVLAVAGGLVMSEIDKADFSNDVFLGNMLFFGMSSAFAFYTLASEGILKRLSPVVLNSWVNTYATLVYIVISIAVLPDEWSNLGSAPVMAYVALVWVVVFSTMLAFVLFGWALQRTSSFVAAVYFPVQTFLGITLAWLFLDEQFTIYAVRRVAFSFKPHFAVLSWLIALLPYCRVQVVGGVLVFSGLALVLYKKYREDKAVQSAPGREFRPLERQSSKTHLLALEDDEGELEGSEQHGTIELKAFSGDDKPD